MSNTHAKKSVPASKKSNASAHATPSITESAEPIPVVEKVASPAPAAASSTTSPLAARVASAVETLQQATRTLNLGDTALSSGQVRRSLRVRKGAEPIVNQLALLSARYGVEVPSRPTAAMTASLALAQQLEPMRAALAELTATVNGAYFSAHSDTWRTATSLYSMLKTGGAREPKLETALLPLQTFFANRHPSVKAKNPKDPTSKAAAKATKAQAKVDAQVAKLQAQIAKLQAAASPAPKAAPPAPAEASNEVEPSTEGASQSNAPPPNANAPHAS